MKKIIIDKQSDIYLNSFTTLNCEANTTNNTSGFIIDIDEIKIQSYSNNNNLSFNKVLIPNKASTNTMTRTHKDKKLNYICSINPCQIYSFTINTTFLDTSNIFSTTNPPNGGKYILELFITPH